MVLNLCLSESKNGEWVPGTWERALEGVPGTWGLT